MGCLTSFHYPNPKNLYLIGPKSVSQIEKLKMSQTPSYSGVETIFKRYKMDCVNKSWIV